MYLGCLPLTTDFLIIVLKKENKFKNLDKRKIEIANCTITLIGCSMEEANIQ